MIAWMLYTVLVSALVVLAARARGVDRTERRLSGALGVGSARWRCSSR